MGRASSSKRQKREERSTGCFECRALQAAQDAFDESLARRGVRFQAEPDCTISTECPECGAARTTNYHGLDDEMKREATNLMRMINRDIGLRRSFSDEVQRLQADFSARYLERCVLLYGLSWLEASQAADERLNQFFIEHAAEFVEMIRRPPVVRQRRQEMGEN